MAHLTITADGRNAIVTLDGHEISNAIAGYTVHHTANDLPRATLDIVAIEHTNDAGEVEVHIPDATADLLRRFGWTPPPGKES